MKDINIFCYNNPMLVFIDEAGDPGFKLNKGSSPIFVIALAVFSDNLVAEETSLAIKKLRRKMNLSDTFEFKFNKSNKTFRNEFFNTVKGFDFTVRAIVVNKRNIRSLNLKTNKEKFYNYIIMQVLKHSGGKIQKAKLKFDSRGEKVLRDELRVYLSRQLNNRKHHIFHDLKFVDSKQNALVQLADMVAGSIFSSYSNKDKRFLSQLTKSGKIDDIWEFT